MNNKINPITFIAIILMILLIYNGYFIKTITAKMQTISGIGKNIFLSFFEIFFLLPILSIIFSIAKNANNSKSTKLKNLLILFIFSIMCIFLLQSIIYFFVNMNIVYGIIFIIVMLYFCVIFSGYFVTKLHNKINK
jgi:hypothetical protein